MEDDKAQNLDLVTITREEYEQLVSCAKWLACLENAGVDNWSGYDYARELFHEETE